MKSPTAFGKSVFSVVMSLCAVLVLSSAAPAQVAEDFEDTVIFATNSVWVKQNADVLSGDIVVNDDSPGPTLASQKELTLGLGTTTPSGFEVKAHGIKVKSSAVVNGNVFCNDLNDGSGNVTCSPLSLPVIDQSLLPVCEAPEPDVGAQDILVPIGGSQTIGPGDYGDITVKKNGVLTFSGGVYTVRSINGGISADLLFDAAATVRVFDKFDTDKNAIVGPSAAGGPSIGAADIVFNVGGVNGSNGNLGATPKAAQVGLSNAVNANFCVPNGTLLLRQNSDVTGAFIAKDVILGIGANASLASAFGGNQPPVAGPTSFDTNGATPVNVTLTGSDPENGNLVFSILVAPDPLAGSITAGPTAIVPASIPEMDQNGPTGNTIEPCDSIPPTPPPCVPTTSATVEYTPATANDLLDAFTFGVTDVEGLVGTAVVSINVPDDSTAPEVTDVDAEDVEVDIAEGAVDADITLVGTGPGGVGLTFRVLTLPAGTLKDSGGAIGSAPADVAGPDLTYTPPAGTLTTSFQYSARDDSTPADPCPTGSPVTCDTSTVSIDVSEAQSLAEASSSSGALNEPQTITLFGNPGGTGTGGGQLTAGPSVLLLPASAVAGNVADSSGNGLGDNHNALPGATPALISAGVGQSGGAGSNGTVRIHMEWDISGEDPDNLPTGATVSLRTELGTVDSLDTMFFVGTTDGNGTLEDADFKTPAAELPGVVMPVPAGNPGDEGTFSIDVTSEVQTAIVEGDSHFVLQGRVDESTSGTARGLQIHSSAAGNLPLLKDPQLFLSNTAGVPTPLVFIIATLPSNGTLTTQAGSTVAVGDVFIGSTDLNYTPNLNISGSDSFTYDVREGAIIATALVSINVDPNGNCVVTGRNVGCAPGQ